MILQELYEKLKNNDELLLNMIKNSKAYIEKQKPTPQKLSDDELKTLCNEMIYQLQGNYIEEHEQCEEQGHPDWQIAMCYLRKINNHEK